MHSTPVAARLAVEGLFRPGRPADVRRDQPRAQSREVVTVSAAISLTDAWRSGA